MSQTLRNDFTGACNVLAEQISLIFPKDRKRQGRRIASAQREREGVEAVVGKVAEKNILLISTTKITS